MEYNLRNGNNLALPKTRHVKTYNSFVPKTIRDWNNMGPIKNSGTIEGFKTRYKRDILNKPNPIYNIDHMGGNIAWTRLRLGLSGLSEHLYTYNIIDSPICKLCNLESESISHYLLRCPAHTVPRMVFMSDLLNVVDANLLYRLKENDIVNLFLFGDGEFPHECNVMLAKMAQTYIVDSNRFSN